MHEQATNFILFVQRILSDYFQDKVVLDVGSGDINGNNRRFFENCEYHGNDVIDAPNVTIVSRTKDLDFEDETFDTIISTECFEHDPEYVESLNKIYDMLKPNGLFCFTCASEGRPEHGTRLNSPGNSYSAIGEIEDMCDYYKNLITEDIDAALNLDEKFAVWDTYYNNFTHDLYFVGIKNGYMNVEPLEKYSDGCVEHKGTKTL